MSTTAPPGTDSDALPWVTTSAAWQVAPLCNRTLAADPRDLASSTWACRHLWISLLSIVVSCDWHAHPRPVAFQACVDRPCNASCPIATLRILRDENCEDCCPRLPSSPLPFPPSQLSPPTQSNQRCVKLLCIVKQHIYFISQRRDLLLHMPPVPSLYRSLG